jgi:hypothetical protein
MGVVTTKADIQGKLANRGTTCMFMGYSVDHSNDVFCMLNAKTRRIINSRDVTWLGKSFKNWSSTHPQSEKDNIDDDLVDLIIKPVERSQVNNEIQPEIKESTKIKLYRQLKRLESSFNPEASKLIKNIEQRREIQLDQANFALFSASAYELEPTSFNDAWNHPDPKNPELWRIVFYKELGEMENKKVWEIIKTRKMFQMEEEQLNVSGFLISKETAYFELDWLLAVTVRFQELILMRVLPLSSMM